MSKGSTKTTTTGPSDPAVSGAYNQLLTQAQGLANQPLSLYGGQLVAPLNATQNAGINQITASGSLAQPYLTEAAGYAQQGATPITQQAYSPSAIQQYYSPYQTDVINSTMALENQQDQQQQQSLAGNITAAGAWGGDRASVLQSQLAGQQALANNSTNAGLENQGFTQAQGQFNTQNAASLQQQQLNNSNAANTAYSLGNIGTAVQNASITGGQAALGAGTVQQQVAQENLNVPYEQYLQQQAYPYQQTQYLASLLPGIASGTGTTSTTNTSGASPWSQILGLGTAIAGIPGIKTGGRVGLADGGAGSSMPYSATPSMLDMLESSQMNRYAAYPGQSTALPSIPNVGQSYVPSVSITGAGNSGLGGGGGDMSAAQTPWTAADTSAVTKAGTALSNAFSGAAVDPTTGMPADWATSGNYGSDSGSGGGLFSGIGDFLSSLQTGGRAQEDDGPLIINPMDPGELEAGGRTATGPRVYLQDGGDDDPADMQAQDYPAGATGLSQADTPPAWRGKVTNYAPDEDAAAVPGSATSDMQAPGSLSNPTWNDGTPVVTDKGKEDVWGASHEPQILPNIYQPKPDWHRALMTAGLAMMAGNSSNWGENVGRGLYTGLNEYYNELDKDNHPEVDHSGPTTVIRYADGTTVDTGAPTEAAINAKATQQYHQDTVDERRQAADDEIAERQQQAQENEANRALQLKIAQQNADAGRYQWQQGTQLDPTTNKPVQGMWRLPTRGGEAPSFMPNANLTPKGASAAAPDPSTVKYLADQYRLTGQLPSLGMGANPMREAILTQAAQDAGTAGQTGADAVAQHADTKTGTQALGQIAKNRAMVEAFSQTASQNADLALNLMAKGAGPTGSPVIDRWVRAGGQNIAGDADVTNFNTALTTFKNEYAKIMSGATGAQGSTDSARHEADTLISPNMSRAQIMGGIQVMKQEMENRRQGLDAQHQALLGTVAGRQPAAPPTAQNANAKLQGGNVVQFPKVTSKQQFDTLSHGAVYTGTDGRQYRKP